MQKRVIPPGRPNCPLAESFRVEFCDGPECGAHIIGEIGGLPQLEIVLSREQTFNFMKHCTEMLAVKQEEQGSCGHA